MEIWNRRKAFIFYATYRGHIERKEEEREREFKQFKIVLSSRPSFSTSWNINKKRAPAPFSADVFNLFIGEQRGLALFVRLKFTFLIHLRVSSRFVVLPRVARNRSMMRLLFYVESGSRYDEPADTMKFSRANCGVRIDPAKWPSVSRKTSMKGRACASEWNWVVLRGSTRKRCSSIEEFCEFSPSLVFHGCVITTRWR